MINSPKVPDHPVHRCVDVFTQAWNTGALDEVTAVLHPDLYAESHRTVVARGTVRGVDAHEAVLGFYKVCPRCAFDVIATRPTGHAACRWRLSGGRGEIEVPLVLVVLADGRVSRAATFDADNLDGALALLDEWAAAEDTSLD